MKIFRRWLVLGCVAALGAGLVGGTAASGSGQDALPAPAGLDLTLVEAGPQAPGWFVPRSLREKGYSAEVAADSPPGGARSLRLEAPSGVPAEGAVGNLMRSFDAAPFRGTRVRFRAAVRVEGTGAAGAGGGSGAAATRAQLWLRVDRPDGAIGFFDNMADRPITGTGWQTCDIAGEVAADATKVNLGVLLYGGGRVWLGAAGFEATGKVVNADEPARPLTDRGLENLAAFARLAGVVRYFHPSDQAAGLDWNRFVLAGVERTEPAEGPEDLARRLTALFRQIAPTMRIFPSGQPPPVAAELLAPPVGAHVLAWRHFGLGLGMETTSGGVYESKRIDGREPQTDADGAPLRLSLPEPGKPLRLDLGGGVSALVPLALYASAAGTLPPAAKVEAPPASSKPEGFSPSGNDRATRLADVILAWNVFQHFYPYFDVTPVDWPAELRRALRSAATDSDERAFRDTLRRLVAALRDGHGGVVMTNAGAAHHLPLLWDWVEDRLVVTEVDRASGAAVQRGDVVTAIDGQPARAAIASREELISAATPQWRRYRALQELLAGPEAEVRLDVQRADGSAGTVTLKRSLPSYGPGAVTEQRPGKIAEVSPGVWYVDVDRVSDDDWKGALDRLGHARGIVFDFRGYPKMSPLFLQSLSGQPLHSAQWHVPVILRPDRAGMTFLSSAWDLQPVAPRLTAKLVFVTDGRAISYAESCLGIVEHYRLGEIVGGPTAGTNGNVNPFLLPGGYRVIWTGMQVLKHDGSRHHGVGIQPTVPVARTLRGIREGRDEALDRAVALAAGAALRPAA